MDLFVCVMRINVCVVRAFLVISFRNAGDAACALGGVGGEHDVLRRAWEGSRQGSGRTHGPAEILRVPVSLFRLNPWYVPGLRRV